ncbi:uncharacterized protein LOC127586608 [Pristis pectinata]|uniref:uncharacterized protein LOC127586608 n=1 Tax=Pristis pectinata TaxID=685728 RepID=UPI00223D5D65|nr:uncharacterized protein LOC127586608 [Pristis pectinata]XP_051900684.1 uncharacterized protein LOC127586608 [Pristis pectinata]XP_051900692.1 uncharacterized protein LOC127586608 [Pristis pectinata]
MEQSQMEDLRRSHNFSDEDLHILLNEVELRRHRLLGNGKSRAPRRVSMFAWKEVAEVVSRNSTVPRSAEQCRKKLNDLSRAARSKLIHNKRSKNEGTMVCLKKLTEYEERATQLLLINVSPVSGAQSNIGDKGDEPLDLQSIDLAAEADGRGMNVTMVECEPEENECDQHLEGEEEENGHTDCEGRQSGAATPTPVLCLEATDLRSLDHNEPQLNVSPSPSQSSSGSRHAETMGPVGQDVSGGSGQRGRGEPAIIAVEAPQPPVRRRKRHRHVDINLEDNLLSADVKQLIVEQNNRHLECLSSIRQEIKDSCIMLCNQLATNNQATNHHLALINESISKLTALAKHVSANTNQTIRDNESSLRHSPPPALIVHTVDPAVMQVTPLKTHPSPTLASSSLDRREPAATPVKHTFKQEPQSSEFPTDVRSNHGIVISEVKSLRSGRSWARRQ